MTASHPAPDPSVIFDTLLAYQRTAALRAGIDLGIFGAVGQGHLDVPALAHRCSASERGVAILCDYLCILGFLSKEGSRYGLTPVSAVFLDPRSPACMASTARFVANPEMMAPAQQLADIVRSGHTTLPGQGSVEPDNPVWVEFAESMGPMTGPSAGALAKISLDGFSGPVRVLDIAAGHGLFGIEVAKQNPEAHVTAVDWQAVLKVARRHAEQAGVADRFEGLAGNAFDVEYGTGFDIALLTNFLHHFDVPTCAGLLNKVRSALKPGGCAATLEFVPNEDRISPPQAAGFSLTMLLSTPSGNAYTFRDLEAMYRAAGFERIAVHPLPHSPQTIVTGYVPTT